MHPLTPLSSSDVFDKLIARSAGHRRWMMHAGEIRLLTPPPKMLPDGQWKEPYFLPVDAVLVALSDDLSGQRGIDRRIVTGALGLLQMDVVTAVDRCAVEDIWVGLVAREVPAQYAKQAKRGFAVVAGTPAEVAAEVTARGLSGITRAWFASLRRAVETVRHRAAEHDIALPDKLTLSTEDARQVVIDHAAARPAGTSMRVQ
jgi:hypothetical protein